MTDGPEYAPAPSKRQELFLAAVRLGLTVIRIGVKLVLFCVALLVAFIAALAWRK